MEQKVQREEVKKKNRERERGEKETEAWDKESVPGSAKLCGNLHCWLISVGISGSS